jgi:integrase
MLPEIKIHKGKARYYIRVRGKFLYLGAWRGEKKPPPAVVARYNAHIRAIVDPTAPPVTGSILDIGKDITVLEALDRFLAWRLEVYGKASFVTYDQALRPVIENFGTTPAKDFGPVRLDQVRQKLVEMGRTRSGINVVVNRTRTAFNWLVSRELIPPDTYLKLKALGALKLGRTRAAEAPLKPVVSEALAEQTAALTTPILAAMIRIQVLTGMRPGEICSMTPSQIDQTRPNCFMYRPLRFKTAYLGKHRIIPLGPKAIEILRPFLEGKGPKDAIFSPAANTAYVLDQRAREATSPSRYDRSVENPTRPPGDFYSTLSYGRAVARLCKRHGLPPWSPSCLRATTAQTVFEAIGLDAAKALLGHADSAVTERHYLRESETRAAEIALLMDKAAQKKTETGG